MRAYVLISVLLFCAGCASSPSRREISSWAASSGVSEAEISGIVSQIHARHRMHVVGFNRQADGSISVMLADKPDRPHGIVVVFRKVGDHWEEDPKSQDEWIV